MSEIVQFSKRRRARAERPEASAEIPAEAGALDNLRIMRGHFVFDERRGSFHRVSETAAFVLAALKQGQPLEAIIEDYARRYNISTIIAQRDVELFVNDLPGVGLRRPASSIAPRAPRRRRTGQRPPAALPSDRETSLS